MPELTQPRVARPTKHQEASKLTTEEDTGERPLLSLSAMLDPSPFVHCTC